MSAIPVQHDSDRLAVKRAHHRDEMRLWRFKNVERGYRYVHVLVHDDDRRTLKAIAKRLRDARRAK